MVNKILTTQFTKIILEAQQADIQGLRALRKKILKAVDKFGARRFVTVTSDVLKNNFCIEGCNDVRTPLKRIFDISLEELEEALGKKGYNLPPEHPVFLLSKDHKDNIIRLKALKLASENPGFGIFEKVQSYYTELDIHIRKEEEVFFPVLEKNGMKEHPGNLREEHETFRELLLGVIEDYEKGYIDPRSIDNAVARVREEFMPKISNHIFRETYIFYPAALEFIKDINEWEKIKKGFSQLGEKYV